MASQCTYNVPSASTRIFVLWELDGIMRIAEADEESQCFCHVEGNLLGSVKQMSGC